MSSEMTNSTLNNIAVFIDFENFSHHDSFETGLLIDKLKERGRLIVKKAYADWGRFAKAKRQMLENSVELIELPSHSHNKNLADIKLVVDALETAITKEYIDTIVVVSGDSDYTPLISKLREYNKYVIVVGAKKQVSKLLKGYCDELIYYSSLVGANTVDESDIRSAYDLLTRAISYLEDQGSQTRSSQVKSHMRQLDSSFNESNYGFSQFKRFLEKAGQEGVVSLKLLPHGDYLIKLATEEKQRVKNSVKAATSQAGTEHASSLVYLICWAIKICQFGDKTIFTLSEIGATIRNYLDPLFELQRYGYSKNQGFKTMVQDVAKQQFIQLEFEPEKNQYYVTPTPKLEIFVKNSSPPKNYQRSRWELMIAKLGLTIDLTQVGQLVSEARNILAEANERNEELTTVRLLEICRERMNGRIQSTVVSTRTMNILLRSEVVKGENGEPIMDIDDNHIISSIEPGPVIFSRCLSTIHRELKLNFQEEVTLEELEETFAIHEPATD